MPPGRKLKIVPPQKKRRQVCGLKIWRRYPLEMVWFNLSVHPSPDVKRRARTLQYEHELRQLQVQLMK